MPRARHNNLLAHTDYIIGGRSITGLGGTRMIHGDRVVWPPEQLGIAANAPATDRVTPGPSNCGDDGSALVAFFRALVSQYDGLVLTASGHGVGYWCGFGYSQAPTVDAPYSLITEPTALPALPAVVSKNSKPAHPDPTHSMLGAISNAWPPHTTSAVFSAMFQVNQPSSRAEAGFIVGFSTGTGASIQVLGITRSLKSSSAAWGRITAHGSPNTMGWTNVDQTINPENGIYYVSCDGAIRPGRGDVMWLPWVKQDTWYIIVADDVSGNLYHREIGGAWASQPLDSTLAPGSWNPAPEPGEHSIQKNSFKLGDEPGGHSKSALALAIPEPEPGTAQLVMDAWDRYGV